MQALDHAPDIQFRDDVRVQMVDEDHAARREWLQQQERHIRQRLERFATANDAHRLQEIQRRLAHIDRQHKRDMIACRSEWRKYRRLFGAS
jgi:hypothetical protein